MSANHTFSPELMEESLHYQELFRLHKDLDDQVRGLKQHPAAETGEIQRLKKMKLQVIDQMHAMELGQELTN